MCVTWPQPETHGVTWSDHPCRQCCHFTNITISSKCNNINYSIGIIRSHLCNLALLIIVLWMEAKLSPLDKYYEVMLRRQKPCGARSIMQMRSELCRPIRLLLILGSTVRVPRGFSTYILYKSPYLKHFDGGRIWAVQGNRPRAD